MDEALLIACKLSREGYGPADRILEMPVDVVIGLAHHSQFVNDYQNTYYALNRKDDK